MTVTPSQNDVISRLLDVSMLRHKVVSQNIANVNTPAYQHQEVAFEDALQEALSRGKMPKDFHELQATVENSDRPAVRADGNNVDIDKELGLLGKNATFYETFTQVLATNNAMMRSAITGRH